MTQIWTNRKSLPDTIRINQLHGQKVIFGHGRSVRDSERIFADGFDGTPDVDDLVAAFEEALGVGGEVVPDAIRTGFVGLVDVDALNGAAEGLRVVGRVGDTLVGGLAANGVVEDEDFGGAGAGRIILVCSLVFARRWSLEMAGTLKATPKEKGDLTQTAKYLRLLGSNSS